ncbi:MAG: undecaprenyl-diphosphate phosphatase [Lutibacter sp.]
MNYIEALVLAFIEGLTEYLPVSSTGHLILASSFFHIEADSFTKLFTIAIQLGAILAVLVLYWKQFLKSFDFYYKLLVAFIPAVVFGLLLNKIIDQLLESPLVVASTLVLGGIILIKVDDWFRQNEQQKTVEVCSDKISYKTAFKIGLFQCLAMIPGTSRSGATIVGGMTQKLDRKTAAEFSFFLAVPTMFGATAKKMFDYFSDGFVLNTHQINLLLLGNVIAFVVSVFAIKGFIDYLSKKGFKLFGYYRIIVGLAIFIIHFYFSEITFL